MRSRHGIDLRNMVHAPQLGRSALGDLLLTADEKIETGSSGMPAIKGKLSASQVPNGLARKQYPDAIRLMSSGAI